MGFLMDKKSKVVVFGGSGFLGSHVADILSQQGYKVIIFDIYKSNYINEDQIMEIGDINDSVKIREVIKEAKYIYHFAGLADINESINNPIETVKKNILGTTLLLDACKDEGVERFLFASSIYVYSELGSFYRTSKQACELLIENYNELYSLDYTILRYGSLYGSRANDFNFIKNAITQGLIEGKIDRKGTGEEVRDYIHVIDAAKASVQLLSEKYINSNIMIKGQQTIRVSELLSMINEILGNEIEIKYSKEQTYEGHYKLTPYSFRPKVAEKLLLETYQDLGQGLLDTIYDIYNDIYKKSPEKLNSSFKIQTDKNNN